MPSLQIPYAFTNNKIPLSPEVAKKGQHFSCPICDSKVILRRGDIRVPHFAHKPDAGCSTESVIHKIAKEMIAFMYNSPFARVSVMRKCPNCSRYGADYFFKDCSIQAKTEVELGRHRLDVAGFKDEKWHFGIEVRNTHPVDDKKWDALRKAQLPAIEVKAEDVICSWKKELVITQLHVDEETPKRLPQLRQKIKVITPAYIILKPVKHNLFLFNDRLPRIHCPDCDKKDLQPSGLEPENLQAPDAVH